MTFEPRFHTTSDATFDFASLPAVLTDHDGDELYVVAHSSSVYIRAVTRDRKAYVSVALQSADLSELIAHLNKIAAKLAAASAPCPVDKPTTTGIMNLPLDEYTRRRDAWWKEADALGIVPIVVSSVEDIREQLSGEEFSPVVTDEQIFNTISAVSQEDWTEDNSAAAIQIIGRLNP